MQNERTVLTIFEAVYLWNVLYMSRFTRLFGGIKAILTTQPLFYRSNIGSPQTVNMMENKLL